MEAEKAKFQFDEDLVQHQMKWSRELETLQKRLAEAEAVRDTLQEEVKGIILQLQIIKSLTLQNLLCQHPFILLAGSNFEASTRKRKATCNP